MMAKGEKKKMYNIDLSVAVAVKGEDIYFSALYHNALLRMNMRTGKTEYLCSFEKEKGIIGMHIKAFCYKSLVWFIPQYGEYIACYDVDRNKMEYFTVPGKTYDRACMEKYCLDDHGEHILPKYSDAGWVDEENIYLVPAGTETVVILNVKTKKIFNAANIINLENEFLGCGTYYEGKVWMAPYEGSQLVSMDMHTGEIQKIDCERELGTYYGICGYEGKIWFSSLTDEGVLFWDIQKGKFGKTPYRDMDFMHRNRTFRDIVNYKDTLWMLPYQAEKIVYLDSKRECFVEYECNIEPGLGVMMEVEAENDSMYAISDTYNYMICWHKDSDGYDIYTPQINVSQLYKILRCNYGENAFSMLLERYHGGIPEKNLEIKDYISLLTYQVFAVNKQKNAGTNNFTGKTGRACFAAIKGGNQQCGQGYYANGE